MTRGVTVLALALLAGCSVGPMPSASTTTANPAGQSYFRVSWDVRDTGAGRTVAGYVVNTYGSAMTGVQLLVQALDANDAVVAQKLAYVPGTLPGFGRSYFEVANLPPAEKYRVTVWAFDRIESPSWP